MVFLWLSVTLLVCLTVWVLGPFLLPLFLGAIFAIALTGFHDRVMHATHVGPKISALIVGLVFTLTILGSMGVVATKFVGYFQDNSGVSGELEKIKGEFSAAVMSVGQKFQVPVNTQNISNLIRNVTAFAQSFIVTNAKRFASEFPSVVLQFVILVLTIITSLMHYQKIVIRLLSSRSLSRERLTQIKDIVTNVCKDVVLSNILTAFTQSSLVALGAAFLTDVDAMITFVITFILAFIPVIGASPVAGVLAIVQLYQHNYTEGILLLVLMAIVGVSDNIVRAWLMTKRGGDSAFLNLLAVIGGIYIWGLPGVFLGPIVMGLTLKLVPLLVKEANKEADHAGNFSPGKSKRKKTAA